MTEIPNYATLIEATFSALKLLGGSGKNDEINSKVAEILELSNEVQDIPHLNSSSLSEVNYRCAWARTILKNYGALENSARSVWTIKPEFTGIDSVDGAIVEKFRNIKSEKTQKFDTAEEKMEEQGVDVPEEVKPWRKRLYEVLINMDPYGFERLTQRVLRECGFTNVVVTKKSGDGGIDGTGKLKINGIFSFNVAFQCKRYSGVVGASFVRDFRGSLTTDIEKGVLITTGTFSKSAKEEASNPGKQQIDLIDGEELIDKIAEYGIGVREVKTYEVDEDFFKSI